MFKLLEKIVKGGRMNNGYKPEKLHSKQQKAIPLLAAGLNDEQVANEIGVTRQTVNKWKNHHILFIDQLTEYRIQLARKYADQYCALYPKAIKVLEDALNSDDPKLRLDAAKTILSKFKIEPIKLVEENKDKVFSVIWDMDSEK
jgi:DNA-binding XRE family transcriptional regulator